MTTKKSDRRKYNPDGANEYTTPKNKPPRYDLRRRHRPIDDPLEKKDRLMEDKLAEVMPEEPTKEEKEKALKIVSAARKEKSDSGFNQSREGIEGFQFQDQGIKTVAQTYKHLAAAFMNLVKANNLFASCKSSQISPDGKLGGKGYIQSIKEIRENFADLTNTMSELIDTFHDEVNSPYWKKTTLEDNPLVKEILSQADEMIDKAEAVEEKKEGNVPPKLSDAEKEKVKSILQYKKWME